MLSECEADHLTFKRSSEKNKWLNLSSIDLMVILTSEELPDIALDPLLSSVESEEAGGEESGPEWGMADNETSFDFFSSSDVSEISSVDCERVKHNHIITLKGKKIFKVFKMKIYYWCNMFKVLTQYFENHLESSNSERLVCSEVKGHTQTLTQTIYWSQNISVGSSTWWNRWQVNNLITKTRLWIR